MLYNNVNTDVNTKYHMLFKCLTDFNVEVYLKKLIFLAITWTLKLTFDKTKINIKSKVLKLVVSNT